MAKIREERVNEEMKKAVSAVIFEMKDPRISAMTSIVSMEVSRDLKTAKVRVSVYDKDEKMPKSTIDALNHAAGFIGFEAGKRMQIRRIPSFKFELDDSIAYSVHISDILNKLNIEKDED
ncbi:MAG: 30S ribosome-binding factor RbfA [Eubacteriales bacterium]|nr:30S ribosome-binding factor RbfA [Eubacteriales bacterium]